MSTNYAAIGYPQAALTKDWHPADVIASIKKRGASLQRISLDHGYYPTTLGQVLRRPWPKGERIIADFLGVPASRIWPSRYRADGSPRSGRGERGIGRYKAKRSTRRIRVNAHLQTGKRHGTA